MPAPLSIHARFTITTALMCLLTLRAFQNANAQASIAQRRDLDVAAFGGPTGRMTGITGARNLAATAGLDLLLHPEAMVSPGLEVRGSAPVDTDTLAAERLLLAGLRIEIAPWPRTQPRLRLFAHALAGRNSIDFGGGVRSPDRTLIYQGTVGNAFAAGGGLTYRLLNNLHLRAEAETERLSTPVAARGHIEAAGLTLGLQFTLRPLR